MGSVLSGQMINLIALGSIDSRVEICGGVSPKIQVTNIVFKVLKIEALEALVKNEHWLIQDSSVGELLRWLNVQVLEVGELWRSSEQVLEVGELWRSSE